MGQLFVFLEEWGILGAIIGFLSWLLKKYVDRKLAEREEREANMEKLMLMMMRTSRATNVLVEATAKAVQRIPDAHCNGDMTAALEKAAAIQKEEKDFMFDQGIKHIFGDYTEGEIQNGFYYLV